MGFTVYVWGLCIPGLLALGPFGGCWAGAAGGVGNGNGNGQGKGVGGRSDAKWARVGGGGGEERGLRPALLAPQTRAWARDLQKSGDIHHRAFRDDYLSDAMAVASPSCRLAALKNE